MSSTKSNSVKPSVVRGQPTPRVRRISSVVRALDVFADPWAFLILREAFFGVRRFDGLRRNLYVARNVLADRLSRLVAEGILERRRYQDRPPRFEYRLTQSGRDFYPAIVALMIWGDRWTCDDGEPPLRLEHKTCRAPLDPFVVCAACRGQVATGEVEVKEGPGAGVESGFELPVTRQSSNQDQFLRGRPCSVAHVLAVIGDRWSLRILRECFLGVKRFTDFQKNLEIARNILTIRLNRLVENGILERRQYQSAPSRSEYVLTAPARELYPSLLLFLAWGDKWRCPDAGPPVILMHRQCGQRLEPLLVCRNCGEPVRASEVTYSMNYHFGTDRQKVAF